MTNEELQNLIDEGDVCINGNDGILRKFVGFDKCKWQTSTGYDSCSSCKGRMKFESYDGNIDTMCHSHGGMTKKNTTDVEIIFKLGKILSEELFEI